VHPRGRGKRARRTLGQVTLPGFREGVGERGGEPELDVSQADQFPPMLFVRHFGGSELVEQQALLGEAEKVLDLPSAKVPRELFEGLLRGLDKEVGRQHPIERVFPGGWIDLGGKKSSDPMR